MKRFAAIIMLTLALLGGLACSAALASAGLEPTADFYVNDYAGVLSAATEAEIMSTAPSLAAETGAQIVVLTVTSLEGQEPHDFAYAVASNWGIGDKLKDNGLLILLAPTEGQIWVEVGYGLEGALNDAKIGRYIDSYALDHYRAADFDRGTLELYKSLLSAVMVEYGLDALPGYEPLEEGMTMSGSTLLIIIGLLLIIMILRRNRRRPRGGPPYGGPPFWGGFGGGNYRGGGFGGGGGFRGGGGGFRGGGGGFGGGGAGRSFK